PLAESSQDYQILQMIILMLIHVYILAMKLTGTDCDVDLDNIFWGVALYVSYLILFTQYFKNSYGTKGKKGKEGAENNKKD
ncbi:unnamed protein product, partial [Allacma fusca]